MRRCLAAGLSVAIAEQTEDPRTAKGLVRREITEVVTPGLVANADRLEGAGANYVAAVLSDQGRHGIAYLDLSTGEFAATETDRRELFEAELDRIGAREIVARDAEKDLPAGVQIRRVGDRDFEPRAVAERVGALPHGLGADERSADARAAAALVATVAELQPAALAQLGALRRYRASDLLLLDRATRRHLELFQNLRDGGSDGTLFATLDLTRTPLGRRRLAAWLGEPLLAPGGDPRAPRPGRSLARARQPPRGAARSPARRRRSRARGDPRAASHRRAARARAAPRGAARRRAHGAKVTPLGDALESLAAELERVLVDDPPGAPRGEPHTGYIRDGVDAELDQIRRDSAEGEAYFANLEARERARTGIPALKVRYNRVFGWSIEVSKARLALVPDDYRRKQTTAGGERFTTDELERWESATLRGARARGGRRSARARGAPRAPARRGRPDPRDRGRDRRARHGPVARPGRARARLGAARGRRLARARDRGRPTPGGGAHRARRLRPERPRARRDRGPLPDPHRPEHGREVDPAAPGRADHAAGPGRLVRARQAGPDRGRRPDLHPRRGLRLSHNRSVHIHGRDERNRRDPPGGQRAELGAAGRDRPWDFDFRWTFDRLGGGGIPPRHGGVARACLVRDPLSRAGGPGPDEVGGSELPLHVRRAGWRNPVPSAHGARGRQSQLRNRGGSCGRTPPQGHPPRARSAPESRRGGIR